MTQLKDKIQSSLDESRMLVLGSQILIGFGFSATFQTGFSNIRSISQNLNLIALTLLLITVSFLICPAAFHQVVDGGKDSARLHRFTTHVMEAALLPFALGVGSCMYVPAERILGGAAAVAISVGVTVTALGFWYGPILLRPRIKAVKGEKSMPPNPTETSIHDKIRHVLTEARVILPGNQALLGFQFAVTLQQSFHDLPFALRLLHLISLSLIAISTILLLSPAAYHRIVEQGEETERFYRVASKFVISALPPMAAGICGDFLVVVYKTTGQWAVSIGCCALMFMLFCGLWFGCTLFIRNRALPLPTARPVEVSP
jgi:hypothetical protein